MLKNLRPMLAELHIRNFSIIEESRMILAPGFQVLSGETGAGKSFLMQALSFVLGERASVESLRAGAEEAVVTAVFTQFPRAQVLSLMQEVGLVWEEEEDTLQIRRSLQANGRSKAFVNDQPVTLKTLQALSLPLVHQVSQHAAAELFSEDFLLSLVDEFGTEAKFLKTYQSAWQEFSRLRQEWKDLEAELKAAQEQKDFLNFQLKELKQAELKVGELEDLEQQKQRLKHRVALAEAAAQLAQGLGEQENNVCEQLASLSRVAEKAANLDGSLQGAAEKLQNASDLLEEVLSEFQHYGEGLADEPASYDQIESRLSLLQNLERKHSLNITQLLEKQNKLEQQLQNLEDSSVLREDKQRELVQVETQLKKVAGQLRKARQKSGKALSEQLKTKLKDLALPHAVLEFRWQEFQEVSQFTTQGSESLELWVSFNPGEDLRRMSEVISGGELSRLLLALYQVLYPPERFGTFIFDEVDAGVSGKVAELMGRQLAALGQKTQVICITHLPQIASLAGAHYTVEKQVRKGRTFSEVRQLDPAERVQELARMLAGVEVTEEALKHAKALLAGKAA